MTGESGLTMFFRHFWALRILLPPMFLLGAVTGIPIALFPALQARTFGSDKFLWAGIFGAAKGLIAMVVAPVLGASSDRYGRKWPLCGVFISTAIPPLLMGATDNLWLYFSTDVFLSCFSGALSIMLACVSDIVPDARGDNAAGDVTARGSQAQGMAVGLAAMALGVGIGATIGTFLNHIDAFRLVAVLSFACAVYAALLMPDVLVPSPELFVPADDYLPPPAVARRPSSRNGSEAAPDAHESSVRDEDRLVPASSQEHPHAPPPSIAPAANIWRAFIDDAKRVIHAITHYPILQNCFLIVLLDSLAEQTMVNLALLYLHDHLGFTSEDQLALLLVTGASGIMCLLTVVPYLTAVIGTVDTLQVSLVANATSIGLYAFVTAKWQAIVIPVLCLFGAGVFPCTSAIAATSVKANEEGLAQGVTSGGRMLAEGLSPFVLGLLFNVFRDTALPGAPFLFASAFVIWALYFTRNLSRRRPNGFTTPDDRRND